MAKWCGIIGFTESVQTAPGVWRDQTTERTYMGDVDRHINRWTTNPDSTNDDLNINNQISIIADPFAEQHVKSMKYIEFMGARWKITSVEVKRPRLILTIGGVYNG